MSQISIIIPIYNCEKFLKECLSSLQNQSFEDFEVICINDCSTDKSRKILEEYAQKDNRIKIIDNEENKGAAFCRNKGIDIVNSKYCMFLDSDDFFDKTMLEKTFNKAEQTNADIVLFETNKYDNKTHKVTLDYSQDVPENWVFNAQTYPKSLFNIVSATPWDRLFRTDFIKNTDVRFLNLKTYNDISFICLTMLLAERIVKISEPLINYRVNVKKSITSKKDKSFTDMNNALRYIYDYAVAKIPYYKDIKHHILDFEFMMYLYYLESTPFNKKERKKYIDFLSSIFISDKYKNLDKSQFDEYYFNPFFEIRNNGFGNLNNKKKNLIKISFTGSAFSKFLKILNSEYLDNFGYYINNLDTFCIEKEIPEIKKFKKHKLHKGNNVLIVEGNNCHGEVIPGVIKYFKDLKFNVDLLITNLQNDFNSTSNIKLKGINKFVCDFGTLKQILYTDKIKEYDCIFFTSYILYKICDELNHYPNVFYMFDKLQKPKHGIYVIEHALEDRDENFIKEGTTFQIADFNVCNPNPKQLNTHYFGKIKITGKTPNFTKFIMVGAIENQRRNCSLLTNAVKTLAEKGYEDFSVTVIGRGDVSYLPENIQPYFNILGRVDFPTMYKAMEEADFFLPLLDPDNSEHDRYITCGTSGSFQLIYGFQKPCLIHKKFCIPMHGFTTDNSLIYETSDGLADKMIEAIEMTRDKYKNMQKDLKNFADGLYKKSLNNLKETLKENGVKNV